MNVSLDKPIEGLKLISQRTLCPIDNTSEPSTRTKTPYFLMSIYPWYYGKAIFIRKYKNGIVRVHQKRNAYLVLALGNI